MTRPTFLSLFSGIGGLDLGLERAGWTCVGQVENDSYCNRVLAKHWPDVPRWGDIREVDPHDLPTADLICGGFPCQPVSLAGQRRGQDDPRWLWPELHRIVRVLRPRWVLLENVPGLLVRGMGDVLGDLAASGYDAEWDCIPASAVGAPHRRDRVWIVAYPQRLGEPRRPAPGERPRRLASGREPVENPDGLAEEQGRRWRGTPEAGELAHANGQAGRIATPVLTGTRLTPLPRPGQARPGRRGGHVADPDGTGRRQGSRLGWTRPTVERNGWWSAEPDVGRVAHGIPGRLDRLGGLGNAVVPQVAELIGRRILESAA